jgi:hypothetical protein
LGHQFPLSQSRKWSLCCCFWFFHEFGVAHKPAVTLLDEWALVSPVVSPIDFLFNDSSNIHLEHRQRPAHLIPLVSVDDLFVWKVFFFLFPFSGTSRVNRPGSRRSTIREPPNEKKKRKSVGIKSESGKRLNCLFSLLFQHPTAIQGSN